MRDDLYCDAFEQTICCEKCGEELITIVVKKEMDNFANKVKVSGDFKCFACGNYTSVWIEEEF